MEKIAQALDIPVQAFSLPSDDAVINIVNSTWNDNSMGPNVNYNPTFNPIDKVVELYSEKTALYERMLQSEQEKVVLLKKTIDKLTEK